MSTWFEYASLFLLAYLAYVFSGVFTQLKIIACELQDFRHELDVDYGEGHHSNAIKSMCHALEKLAASR